MQLAFEEKGDVTVVRVQEAKLTYPVLSSFFSRFGSGSRAGRVRCSSTSPRSATSTARPSVA